MTEQLSEKWSKFIDELPQGTDWEAFAGSLVEGDDPLGEEAAVEIVAQNVKRERENIEQVERAISNYRGFIGTPGHLTLGTVSDVQSKSNDARSLTRTTQDWP